jgi:hypothetical protein
MNFFKKQTSYIDLNNVKERFKDKEVIIIGSAPSCLQNTRNFVESFDEIVRINNYKTKGIDKRGNHYDYTDKVGERTDYHFSFYGGSVKKTQADLRKIKAHLCKCPNDVCHITEWAKQNGQIQGGDFRPLYRRREGFWVAPVYIPEKYHYLKLFRHLDDHVPTTGFYAIWEIMRCKPKRLYITGFDFFSSGVHNVDEKWKAGKKEDPICHVPEKEKEILKAWYRDNDWFEIDMHLKHVLGIRTY